MKYRGIYFLIITLFSILGCKRESSKVDSNDRPNIIWLVAEDQSPEFFSFYGNKTIDLPNLELLAQDAMQFNRAYATVPVCAPSRSSLITGLYPTTLGTHNMRTYNAYKPANEETLGIPSYSPILPKGVKVFTELLRAKGYHCTNNAKEHYNFDAPSHSWDRSGPEAHWRDRANDSPFFSVFNFGVCHESGIWKYKDSTLFVDRNKLEVPPYFPDTKTVRHDLAVNYSNLKRLDDAVGIIIDQLKEDGLYENSYIFFYSDHGGPFPRHKRSLQETGIRVPLLVKFPANKHRGSDSNQLVSFIDFAPTVLSLAGIEPPDIMQGNALFGEYQSKEERKYLFASADRFDEIKDRKRAVVSARWKYIRNYKTELPDALPLSYREQMPMMAEMRLLFKRGDLNENQEIWFRSPQEKEELYDLENDPYELNNLAGNKNQQDTMKHYSELLDRWINSTGDLGEFQEDELIERWLVDGKQPKLPKPNIIGHNQAIKITTSVEHATIIWRSKWADTWKPYTEPIPAEDFLMAKITAIGYEDSETVGMEN